MKAALPALLLLLSGCLGRVVLTETPSAAQQACAEQAEHDPAVEKQRAITAGNLDYQWQNGPLMRQIKQDAITRCLRARGLAARGGVERPR